MRLANHPWFARRIESPDHAQQWARVPLCGSIRRKNHGNCEEKTGGKEKGRRQETSGKEKSRR
jgi:hypothetical protein